MITIILFLLEIIKSLRYINTPDRENFSKESKKNIWIYLYSIKMQVLFVAKTYITRCGYKVPRIILWFLHSQTVRYALNNFEIFLVTHVFFPNGILNKRFKEIQSPYFSYETCKSRLTDSGTKRGGDQLTPYWWRVYI